MIELAIEILEGMGVGFESALAGLRMGQAYRRDGWNGKGMYIKLQVPDAGSKMTLHYIYMFTAQGNLVPWVASQTDLLARDWVGLVDV